MKTTPTTTSLVPRPPNRLAVACAAAALLWCAWGYCIGEGGNGLLWTTTFLSIVALALPRPLPGNLRWVIWGSLALTVICMAANVERLVPAQNDYGQIYVLDRVVTVAFASIGVSALFFRMSAVGVTKILLGTLPMTMLAIARQAEFREVAIVSAPRQVWVLLGWVALLELARQAAVPREGGARRLSWREQATRGVWMAVLLGLAMLLRGPIERVARDAQSRILGMSMPRNWDRDSRRESELPLWRALPRGFGGRMQLLLLVRAKAAPGYLREGVFTVYERGRWLAPVAGEARNPVAADVASRAETTRYPLTDVPDPASEERMRFDVLVPKLFTAIALPGNAVMIHCAGEAPQGNADGMLRMEAGTPTRYDVDVAVSGDGESAYPGPAGLADPAYLAVPAGLAGDVARWVEACPGLTNAATAVAAANCIENDFAVRFGYRSDVQMRAKPDPLIDFMKRREGFCIHFASAAALMLRARGIPARVVGGYVCSEWAPWLRRWVVRERQGHAWVEAWERDEQRWFLVEPTPPGGLPDQHRRPGVLRRLQDVLIAGWKRLVGFAESANFLQVLADAGAAVILFLWSVIRNPWGALLLTGCLIYGVWRKRRSLRHRRSPETKVRDALTQALNRRIGRCVPERLSRRAYENWDDWLVRIQPELPPADIDELLPWVERYQSIRYRATLDVAEALAWIQHVSCRE